jgi:hypothetical protein
LAFSLPPKGSQERAIRCEHPDQLLLIVNGIHPSVLGNHKRGELCEGVVKITNAPDPEVLFCHPLLQLTEIVLGIETVTGEGYAE